MESRIIFLATLCVFGYGTLFLYLAENSSAKELLSETTCGDELLTLDCGNLSVIAIHQAYFTRNMADVANLTCNLPALDANDSYIDEDEDEFIRNSSLHCYEDLRVQINKRCSGLNRCNYSHIEEGQRLCESTGGAVIVHYDCVREKSLQKYCNTKLHFKEGYIASPGYPSYYPHLEKCNWTIQAAEGQIVSLQLLHVNMRPARITYSSDSLLPLVDVVATLSPMTYHCDDDILDVLEGSTKRESTCGEDVIGLKSLELDANKGAIIQFSSREFFPGSGFLVHYKIKGCPTLSPPSGGYKVYRNGSEAKYMCKKGNVFNDTLEASRTLLCIGEHRWNDTLLSPCISLEEILKQQQVYQNQTLNELRSAEYDNLTIDKEVVLPSSSDSNPMFEMTQSFIEDFLVPSILIAILIFGNIIIVIIIFIYRRRQKKRPDDFDDEINPRSQPLMQATDV